jgi:hypothetical protein
VRALFGHGSYLYVDAVEAVENALLVVTVGQQTDETLTLLDTRHYGAKDTQQSVICVVCTRKGEAAATGYWPCARKAGSSSRSAPPN